MIRTDWRYAVQILREDYTPVQQVPVTVDWDPLREWLRFVALQRGSSVSHALSLDATMSPIWSSEYGEPYLRGIRGHAHDDSVGDVMADYPVSVFNAPAKVAAGELVLAGVLADGEVYRILPLAFAHDAAGNATSGARFQTRSHAPELAILEGSLSTFFERAAGPLGCPDDDERDCQVFIPESILDETRTLAHDAEARETGGLLVGHLRRDAGQPLFLEVTAQLPAQHVDASETKLTFTSETWTAFRTTLALRRRGEIMLGWWHSHPVREWCKACALEKQRVCSLRGNFLSEDDRLLHRAIFPRSYSLALVVNDVGYQDPTLSLFGWREGLLTLRGYRVLDPATLNGNAMSPLTHAPRASTEPEAQHAHS